MSSPRAAEAALSVVVACPRDAGTLPACLAALAAQAPAGAETLLADPWDRPLPPEALAVPGLKIRHVRLPGPAAAASNAAVRAAAGPLVLHLSGGHIPLPGLLADHAAALAGACFSAGRLMTAGGDAGPFASYLESSERRLPRRPAEPGSPPRPASFCPANLAFRKDAFISAGGFDEENAAPFPDWADMTLGARALSGAPCVHSDGACAAAAAPVPIENWLEAEEAIGRERARLAVCRPDLEPLYAAKYEAYALHSSRADLAAAEAALLTVINRLEGLPAAELAMLKAVRRGPQGEETSGPALFELYTKLFSARRAAGLHEGLCARLGANWTEEYSRAIAPFSESVRPAFPKLPVPERPLFSVLVPVWNSGAELDDVAEGFLAQAGPELGVEIIFADDGSGPGTLARLAALAVRPGVKVIYTGGHKGQSAATNAAAAAASGDYLMLSAADIGPEPDLLARHLADHRAAPDEIMVLGYLPWGPKALVSRFMRYIVSEGTQFGYGLITDPQNVGPEFVYAPNLSLRAELFRKAGGFDERFIFGAQDSDFGVRVRSLPARIVYDAGAVAHHNHTVTLERFLNYRQPLAGKGQVQYALKWPVPRPLEALKEEAALRYLPYRETPWLPGEMYETAMRLEDIPDADCPAVIARDPLTGRSVKTPARAFVLDFLLNYHRCAGVYEEIKAREGAAWAAAALRSTALRGSPEPEKLAWHASRTLGAIKLYLEGLRRSGPFDRMKGLNYYCAPARAERGREKGGEKLAAAGAAR